MTQHAIIETDATSALIKAINECQEHDVPVVKAEITAQSSINNGTSQKVFAIATYTNAEL